MRIPADRSSPRFGSMRPKSARVSAAADSEPRRRPEPLFVEFECPMRHRVDQATSHGWRRRHDPHTAGSARENEPSRREALDRAEWISRP